MRGSSATISTKQETPRAVALCSMLLGVPLLCNSVKGQVTDGGPIVVHDQEALEFFRLTEDSVAVEFLAEFRSGETTPAKGKSLTDKETRIYEILEYGGKGYLGHPNLFELEFLTRFRLEQRDYDLESTGRNQSTVEALLELDARGTFMRRSDTPITIFANRDQNTIEQAFGGTLDNIRSEFGVTANILNGALPSDFTLRHIVLEQENSLNRTTFDQTRDILEWHGSARPLDHHRLWWDASFESVSETGNLRRTNSFDRIDVTVNEEFLFGKARDHRLISTIRLRDETGDFSLSQFRWDERLHMNHTKSFKTDYSLLFDESKRIGQTQTFIAGTASFHHQLFDSLTTTGEAGINQLELDEQEFKSTNQFGQLGLDYTKTVPYGRLFASGNLGLDFQDEGNRGSPIFLNDQAQTFGPFGIIVLSQRNITKSSIVITDLTGTILYSDGLDYLVDSFDERTEIRRIPGGLINPNQTVLIDYEIGPEPGSTITTVAFGFSGRYDFEEGALRGLSIYGRYRELNQDRSSDSNELLPVSDLQELTYGAEYTFWRFSLLAEQKIHESSLSPFDSTRLEADYRQFFGRDHALLIRGFHQIVDRKADDLESTVTNVTARFNSRLSTRWAANVEAIYREESDSRGRNFSGLEQRFEILWRHRQTTFSASLNNTWSETNSNENTFQTITIGFRREF